VGINWGADNKPVTVTERDIEYILTKMGEVLTNHSQSALMEQFRKLVRVESELSQERATVVRLNAHITQLEARVQQLSGFLNSAMNANTAVPMFQNASPILQAPAQTTIPVPLYGERFSASVPAPSLDGTPIE
jgi:glutamate mutase epsilon subunit